MVPSDDRRAEPSGGAVGGAVGVIGAQGCPAVPYAVRRRAVRRCCWRDRRAGRCAVPLRCALRRAVRLCCWLRCWLCCWLCRCAVTPSACRSARRAVRCAVGGAVRVIGAQGGALCRWWCRWRCRPRDRRAGLSDDRRAEPSGGAVGGAVAQGCPAVPLVVLLAALSRRPAAQGCPMIERRAVRCHAGRLRRAVR